MGFFFYADAMIITYHPRSPPNCIECQTATVDFVSLFSCQSANGLCLLTLDLRAAHIGTAEPLLQLLLLLGPGSFPVRTILGIQNLAMDVADPAFSSWKSDFSSPLTAPAFYDIRSLTAS